MKDAPDSPAAKIKMMQASLNCLTFGMLGLLPFIGLLFALIAGWYAGQARSGEKHLWNPAQPLRIMGVTCAVFGALAWTIVGCLVIWHIYNHSNGDC